MSDICISISYWGIKLQNHQILPNHVDEDHDQLAVFERTDNILVSYIFVFTLHAYVIFLKLHGHWTAVTPNVIHGGKYELFAVIDQVLIHGVAVAHHIQ